MIVKEPSSLEDLKALLAEAGSTLVVVDFYASWCGPCRLMMPKFTKFADEFPDVIFSKMDIDEQKEAASHYQIEVMPTFVFIKDGKQIAVVKGKNEDEIRDIIMANKSANKAE